MKSRLTIVVALALALGLSPTAGSTAGIIECTLSASVSHSVLSPGAPATYDWDVIMIGSCGGDREGRYSAFGSADGTSLGLGLCDGSLLMQNLNLDVFLFLDSVRGPAFSKFLHERWSAPVTTYPLATPFLIDDVSGAPRLIGAGVLSNHIFLNCGPTSSPSTLILRVSLR